VRFEHHVERAIASLPPELREAVQNVEISVEDELPGDPDCFGLYEGVPLPERGDWAGALPDRIRIFRLPLVESFPDPDELSGRSGSPSSTSWPTISGSTRTGSKTSGIPEENRRNDPNGSRV